MEKRVIDRETKIMLLTALRRGFFEQSDIDLLRGKYNEISEIEVKICKNYIVTE